MGPKKKSLVAEGDEIPSLLKEFPSIQHFVINTIDTNHGIQIPALLHSLAEVFGRRGLRYEDFQEPDFLEWINKILIEKNQFEPEISNQIGRDVGISVDYSGADDPNKDPFLLLDTGKSAF